MFTRIPYRWIGSLVLAAVLLVPAASAQDRTDRQNVVIRFDNGDSIVIVDGEVLSDEAAERYLEEHDFDGPTVHLGPGPHVRVYQSDEADDIHTYVGRFAPGAFFFDGDNGRFEFDEMFGDRLHALRDNLTVLDDFGGQLERGLAGSMRESSEIARMDMESRRLARQVRNAEGAERERLEGELEELLAEIFEKKQALRAQRIERLQDELDKLETDQRQRTSARQEIIERRLRELLGERDVYDW